MRQRESAKADKCLTLAEKRREAMKANVVKSQSTLSTDGISSSWTLVAVHRESAKAKRLSDVATVGWRLPF